MPQVKIPPPYRGPTQGQVVVAVEGRTVGDCLKALADGYPGLGELLLGPRGEVHRFVTLFVNADEIDRGALDTPLADGDELEILTAVAGG
jgi:molybdopterin converting factor small subunit